MSGDSGVVVPGPPAGATPPPWPWETPGARQKRSGWKALTGRVLTVRAWPLSAATVAVLVVGYGWLGSVVAGGPGAAVGCGGGLLVSGLLYALVETLVSGPRPVNRRPRLTRR
ncbi:hypothetical protein [Streptomyces sp. NPDC058867]|uniref:hypothetical protein n=1 Tax=unclassified Streptomyces TaxID=2593676 RepID=UPI0036739CB0